MFLAFVAPALFQRVLVLPLVSLWISIYFLILEVIIDYGSAFITYGNEIKSKGVQFQAEMALIKSVGAATRQSPRYLENMWLCTTGTPKLGCVLTNAIDYSRLVTC